MITLWLLVDGEEREFKGEALYEVRDPEAPQSFAYRLEGVRGYGSLAGSGPFVMVCSGGEQDGRTISGYALAYAFSAAGFVDLIPWRPGLA